MWTFSIRGVRIRIPIASGRGQEGTQVREPTVRRREEFCELLLRTQSYLTISSSLGLSVNCGSVEFLCWSDRITALFIAGGSCSARNFC